MALNLGSRKPKPVSRSPKPARFRAAAAASAVVFCCHSATAQSEPCRQWRGLEPTLNSTIHAIAEYNGELVVGGLFTFAGSQRVDYIARWDGSSWRPVGGGMNAGVFALLVHDDHLFVGGSFTTAGGQPANHIARWNGSSWAPLAGAAGGLNDEVRALTIYPEVNGDLVAGGRFTFADGVGMNRVARWDGVSWHQFASGLSNGNPGPGIVHALAVFDGSLIAGGNFMLHSHNTRNVARWDGSSWQPVGGGISGPSSIGSDVHALAIFDNTLIAGGAFVSGGSRIARLVGSAWHSIGLGMDDAVLSLAVEPPGQGNLFAGGRFATVHGRPGTIGIARWNGSDWRSLENGVAGGPPVVHALAAVGDNLIVGGAFSVTTASNSIAERLAVWGQCSCYANCDESTAEPILNVDDFTCFINEFAAAQALPHEQQLTHYSNCDNSTQAPVLNVDDFTCFINEFAAGCP